MKFYKINIDIYTTKINDMICVEKLTKKKTLKICPLNFVQ